MKKQNFYKHKKRIEYEYNLNFLKFYFKSKPEDHRPTWHKTHNKHYRYDDILQITKEWYYKEATP